MTMTNKLRQLETLYTIYDEFAGELDLACTKGCSDCCTRNVVITTLEGYRLAEYLDSGQNRVYKALQTDSGHPRFIPEITTNRLAKFCMDGRDPPEERTAAVENRCSLLSESACGAYLLRPFGCRCMVSRRRCASTGHAEMDDFTVTVNTVFMQFLEHIDADGCSGNLVDVLLFLRSKTNRIRYRRGLTACPGPALIPNSPIPVLMIPPEHRELMSPWIQSIQRRLAQ